MLAAGSVWFSTKADERPRSTRSGLAAGFARRAAHRREARRKCARAFPQEAHGSQGFSTPFSLRHHTPGCLAQLHLPQLCDDRERLATRRFQVFLRMDGFEHRPPLPSLSQRALPSTRCDTNARPRRRMGIAGAGKWASRTAASAPGDKSPPAFRSARGTCRSRITSLPLTLSPSSRAGTSPSFPCLPCCPPAPPLLPSSLRRSHRRRSTTPRSLPSLSFASATPRPHNAGILTRQRRFPRVTQHSALDLTKRAQLLIALTANKRFQKRKRPLVANGQRS